jgi:REP-associated tyrosine transposase
MPRQRRYFIPNIPQHVITRGVDRQPVFFQEQDYSLYLEALQEAAAASDCLIHAYVLMTNHVHLLVTPGRKRSLPLMMQAMGRNYVQRLNVRYRRTGTLWEGRYKASLVQDSNYLLTCQRYIELNPVRARMVAAPGEYPYSSFAHHATGSVDSLISAHSCYLELAVDPSVRQQAYRALFHDLLDENLLAMIRKSTNACGVIGDHQFKEQIEAMLGRAVPTGARGRPRLSK